MNKRIQAIVNEAKNIIDSRLVGDKSVSRDDCKEALEEIEDCAQGWLDTFAEEDRAAERDGERTKP